MDFDLMKAQVNPAVPVFIRDHPVSGNEPDAGRFVCEANRKFQRADGVNAVDDPGRPDAAPEY